YPCGCFPRPTAPARVGGCERERAGVGRGCERRPIAAQPASAQARSKPDTSTEDPTMKPMHLQALALCAALCGAVQPATADAWVPTAGPPGGFSTAVTVE